MRNRRAAFRAFLAGGGAVVPMIEQPPVLHFGDRNALQAAVHLRRSWGGDGTLPVSPRSAWAVGNAMIRRVAAAHGEGTAPSGLAPLRRLPATP
ncbi:MAG: hypothetical protein U1F77_04430 [Kiritimatiellia bacterium]